MRRSIRRRRGALLGSRDGYSAGYSYGYHLGRCQAVYSRSQPPAPVFHEMSVMYVAQGTPGFRTMDIGIAEALRAMVRQVITVSGIDPVAEIAERYRPDLVLVLNGVFSIGTDQVDRIRRAGIRTAVWIADDPYFSDQTREIAGHYDFIFTHEISCVALYREAGYPNVHYLPFGVSPQLFKPLHVDHALRTDICFIGMAFPNRIAFFDQIAKYLSDKKVLIAGGGWQAMANYGLLKEKIRLEGIDPVAAPSYYSGAKIVINLHRSAAEKQNSRNYPGLSLNPRTFEISACGTLQLVDSRSELAWHYVPGQEIETYSTPQELVEKIQYYLREEARRRDIAVKGLKRTMRSHTYGQRLPELLAITQSRGGVTV